MHLKRLLGVLLLPLVLAGTLSAVRAETLQGSNIDARVLLGYAVAPEAVQPFLPEGWTALAFPQGPMTGATLLVGLLDRALQLDATGAPSDPASSRHVVLVALGMGDDGPRMFVLRTYSTEDGPGAYGNAIRSGVSRAMALDAASTTPGTRREAWRVTPASGGALDITADFAAGRKSWSDSELTPYSNVDPDFFRIYRYSQLTDVVMSEALGRAIDGSVTLTNSIPELAAMFDGSERLVAVLDVPVYVRKVYLP